MSEFFKPKRRMIGLALLVSACVMTTGWFRSHSINDTFSVPLGQGAYWQVASSNQHLIFGSVIVSKLDPNVSGRLKFWMSMNIDRSTSDTNWKFFEFNALVSVFGTSEVTRGATNPTYSFNNKKIYTVRYDWVGYQYWLIVLPVTMICAWLLLSKTRSQPKSSAMGIDAVGHSSTLEAGITPEYQSK